MSTVIIAVTFSFISLSLSKLVSQWKETKKYRNAKKEMKEKQRLLGKMSSKDLLSIAKFKDKENFEAVTNKVNKNNFNEQEGKF